MIENKILAPTYLPTNQKWILYVIILLEGFVTISLEILTIRQLTPVVGNSVIVTSLIIGIFLLFLAYGYRKGGTYHDHYVPTLRYNFILAAVGFGIGLSYTFIENFFSLVQTIIPHSTLLPLTAYLVLIIAPIVYWLGQTIPITLNLWKHSQSIGETGGQILHLSTIGSFLGSTVTALVLLNYVGVAWSIVFDFYVLLFLILLLSHKKSEGVQFIALLFLSVLVYFMNVSLEHVWFVKTNNYGNYQVLTANHQREKLLKINDSNSSYLDPQNRGFPYVEMIKKILFDDLKLRNQTILVLGAGGFTLSAQGSYGNHFIYVDIDKQIAHIVKKEFLNPIQGTFIADDARHFLKHTPQQFSVILSDAYTNRRAVPAHLVTKEYFSAIVNALTPEGIAIFNVLANPSLEDRYSKHMDSTIRSVFHNCMVMPLRYSANRITNILYICKKSPNENDNEVYSDNLNRATLDYFALKQ